MYFSNSMRFKWVLAACLSFSSGLIQADFRADYWVTGLQGSDGVVLNGATAAEKAGTSVSAVGDINGDGIEDLAVGAPFLSGSETQSGAVYLVFGTDQAANSSLNLSTINGTNGILITSGGAFDWTGFSVSPAGDFNNDGVDDLLIGSAGASTDDLYSGAAYIVFGDDQGLPHPFDLSGIDGSNGVKLNGYGTDSGCGTSVSGGGDINGDTIDDVVIGAPYAAGGAGHVYVVFGSSDAFSAAIDLDTLNGTNGFTMLGVEAGDSLGSAVSILGDIDGSGIDDLVAGAPLAGPPGDNPGSAYVILGSDTRSSALLSLASLGAQDGFALEGDAASDFTGDAVGSAGDINNDGLDDLVIGAPQADPNGGESGTSYIVFGDDQGFTSPVSLAGLDGDDGFSVLGVMAGDKSSTAVSSIGDLNGDAIDELIIGAPYSDVKGNDAGAAYIVFGSAAAWSASLELSALDGSDGFVLGGAHPGDRFGSSLGLPGDINNDGRDEPLLGAPHADPAGANSGAAYLLFDVSALGVIFLNGFE